MHYFDPHYSYIRHPAIGFAGSGSGRLRGGESLKQMEALLPSLTGREQHTLRALYDEEVRFTDAGIGRLLDALRRTGRWDETVVAVVSDHGEEFFDHGGIAHGHSLYEELLRVPLLVSVPGAGGGRVIRPPVTTAALAATLLDLMGVSAEALAAPLPSFSGLLAGDETDAPVVFAELGGESPKGRRLGPTHRLRALVAHPWKLVHDERKGSLELFDLAQDPTEKVNLADREREVARDLETRLARHTADLLGLAVAAEEAPIGARDAELLRELGYVAE